MSVLICTVFLVFRAQLEGWRHASLWLARPVRAEDKGCGLCSEKKWLATRLINLKTVVQHGKPEVQFHNLQSFRVRKR